MSAVARRVSDCDLTARAQKLGDDEIGTLAESLNRIGENLTVTLSRVQTVTGGVATVIERISRTGSAVSSGAGTVTARVVDTSSSMGQMIVSLKGIADNVEVLAQSAEESSSSILEMAATNDEVAENIQALAASVEETTAAIEQMTYSIKEVAKNIEELSATTEETSSSMNEMDVSISQVETNANETAKLSEQAQRDAEMGAEALSRTLGGIDKIKESSKEAANVIEALGNKIAAIGNILNVIDDVAEQTNLLALNAAILAAQSGEHGKGFAVVADEIKELAERTGASTKEISELIRAVQEQSKNAITAMDRGVRNVEEGVRLGQETETALKKIQESSQKSTQMVKAIARATIEQARGSKQVTMAINRIAETVQQIATATAEQARGSEQIMKSAEKMKAITKHVERSAQEQARGSKQITRSIESISEMVNHLNRAQKEQTKGSEQVMTAVVQIKQVAEAQTVSVRELEAAIVDLASQAEVLRGEVRRFRV
jgi:methyl-accepting chemotaxis protein